jgi:hypothetical protein
MANRTFPFQLFGSATVVPPTPFTSVALAACHYDPTVTSLDVLAYVDYPVPGSVFYSTWDYYFRCDDNWWYDLVSPHTGQHDNNHKFYNSCVGGSGPFRTDAGSASVAWTGYADPGDGSTGGPISNTGTQKIDMDIPSTLGNVIAVPDNNGHFAFWDQITNPSNPTGGPTGNGWKKWSIVIKWTSDTTGYQFMYDGNGTGNRGLGNSIFYHGPTIPSGKARWLEAIGSCYARNQGPTPSSGAGTTWQSANGNQPGKYTQWGYLANTYFDVQTSGLGRFYATNTSTFTIGGTQLGEIQPYTSWAPTSVNLTFNRANLSSGTGALWYVDEANGISPPVQVANLVIS